MIHIVQKYELREYATENGHIIMTLKRSIFDVYKQTSVKHPNFIERAMGITFEQKVLKTRSKMQALCDKLNLKIEDAERLAHENKINFSNPPRDGTGVSRLSPPIPRPVKIEEGD